MIWKKCLLKAREKVGEDTLKNPIYEWKTVKKTRARFTRAARLWLILCGRSFRSWVWTKIRDSSVQIWAVVWSLFWSDVGRQRHNRGKKQDEKVSRINGCGRREEGRKKERAFSTPVSRTKPTKSESVSDWGRVRIFGVLREIRKSLLPQRGKAQAHLQAERPPEEEAGRVKRGGGITTIPPPFFCPYGPEFPAGGKICNFSSFPVGGNFCNFSSV